MQLLEYLLHMQGARQKFSGLDAPIVEVASDDQRRTRRYQFLDAVAHGLQLLHPAATTQTQMHVHAMQLIVPARYLDYAMQQAATFHCMGGDIDVFPADDGITG